MNYQDFLSEVTATLTERIDPKASLQVKSMPKNNGICCDGLIIMNPGRNISPTIYLTPYYHRYLEGVQMEDIFTDILSTYWSNLPEQDFDTSRFTDFEKVRPRIVMRLVNYARNEQLLADVPHYRFLDLAVIFYCLLHVDTDNQASILVHNSHLPLWNVNQDTIYALARSNTPRLLPERITPIDEILAQLNNPEIASANADELPMLVLSNRSRTNGASVLLYDGLLARIAGCLDSNLLLLPSSIHEIILLPVADGRDVIAANQMVREVNETQLADEEILSDHAYYYDRNYGRITY